jgi:hypothetical protein
MPRLTNSYLPVIVRSGLSGHALTLRHALIQDAAYQALLRSKRRRFHRAVAETLVETLPETAETQPELVAYHYMAADLAERAVAYWQRAGERALARSANFEAVDHFQKALVLAAKLETSNERSHALLAARMSLGQALSDAGQMGESVAAFGLAAHQAREQGNTKAFVTCALGFDLAQFLANEPLDQSTELLTEALSAINPTVDKPVRFKAG